MDHLQKLNNKSCHANAASKLKERNRIQQNHFIKHYNIIMRAKQNIASSKNNITFTPTFFPTLSSKPS